MKRLLLGLLLGAGSSVSSCEAAAGCSDTGPLPESRAAGCLRFGVSTPGGPTAEREFRQVASAVGRAPSIVLSYADFKSAPPIEGLRSVARVGADPMVTRMIGANT